MTASDHDVSSLTQPPASAIGLSQAQYWQEHIQSWAHSGLSQSAYCRREGLILHRWHYWHKKLSGHSKDAAESASGFIPVKVLAPPSDHDLSITLANGIRISGVTAQTLPLLSAVLKQL